MRIAVRAVRGGVTAVLTGALSCALSGCFLHKKVQPQQPVILAKQTPVLLETPAVVTNPPLLDAPKQAKLPAVPVAEAATKPKRVRRRPKQTAAAAAQSPAAGANVPGQTSAAGTVQVAGGTAPPPPGATTAGSAAGAETVIGALTPGGADQTPQARQDAQALLASTDRRLNALPAQTQQTQKTQISQVRNFWRQGVDAFKAGDAEGARTLALKAKLLLDDLEKAGQ